MERLIKSSSRLLLFSLYLIKIFLSVFCFETLQTVLSLRMGGKVTHSYETEIKTINSVLYR
jgi:hypothetical protein